MCSILSKSIQIFIFSITSKFKYIYIYQDLARSQNFSCVQSNLSRKPGVVEFICYEKMKSRNLNISAI